MFEDQLKAERDTPIDTITGKTTKPTTGSDVALRPYSPTPYATFKRKRVLKVKPEVGAASPDQGPAVSGSKVEVSSSESYGVKKGQHEVAFVHQTQPGYLEWLKNFGRKPA